MNLKLYPLDKQLCSLFMVSCKYEILVNHFPIFSQLSNYQWWSFGLSISAHQPSVSKNQKKKEKEPVWVLLISMNKQLSITCLKFEKLATEYCLVKNVWSYFSPFWLIKQLKQISNLNSSFFVFFHRIIVCLSNSCQSYSLFILFWKPKHYYRLVLSFFRLAYYFSFQIHLILYH